ncbi:glycosyltransferase [Ferruginibacter paludis]|uniref:glycosyltransferase n=1 Tax=Ferruginibacter paludis TaxID=1310417 RepID=UPI0025B2E741|nr:glycosyltransferase [Ferruginibacter paludis]MDN3654411.1 glycosyltransferase [Ferruginibacter paludis]
MNYWLLTTEYPPEFGGGISTYCLHTAVMLQQQDWKVSVFVKDFSVKKKHEQIEASGVRVIRFNPNAMVQKSELGFETAQSYAFAEIIKQYLETEGIPEALESQEFGGIAYYIINYKWLQYPLFKNLKIIVTLHAPSFLYYEYNKVPYHRFPYFWIGEMERFCIRGADLLISPSQYLVDELKVRMKLDDLEITVVPNPYVFKRQSVSLVNRKDKLIFFGKLTLQKGAIELIQYFQQLWENGFEHPLYMIGGGNHMYYPEGTDIIHHIKRKYKKEIAEEKLQLLGSIHEEKIDGYLSNACVVIIPSLVDNLPYTVLEAMSKGRIVLASVQGGQSEIIEDGVNGFLFSHNETGSFKNRLNTILLLTDEEVNEISKRALEYIECTYTYNVIFKKKALLVNQLLQKNTARKSFPFIRPIIAKEESSLAKIASEPLLTVVLPFYNMGMYVEESIKSIIASSYKHIEIIVIDDGSTDPESLKVLGDLSKKYNFLIHHKKNEGLALARNTGALMARGELMAFLDPDDTVEAGYYQKAIQVLTAYDNIGFVGCWGKYFGNSEKIWPAFNPEPPYLLTHNSVNSSALVYRKESFLKAGLNDAAMIYGMEDYDSVINMVKNGFQGVVIPEPLWNYRIRKNSMARAFTNDKQLYLYRLISEKHADFYATFATDISNLLNANGPGMNYDNPTLMYGLPGAGFISQRVKQKMIAIIKSNSILRKAAITVKRWL